MYHLSNIFTRIFARRPHSLTNMKMLLKGNSQTYSSFNKKSIFLLLSSYAYFQMQSHACLGLENRQEKQSNSTKIYQGPLKISEKASSIEIRKEKLGIMEVFQKFLIHLIRFFHLLWIFAPSIVLSPLLCFSLTK